MNPSNVFPGESARARKRKATATSAPTPPVDLVLVSATYDPGLSVTLTFDRPIDVSGFDGSVVFVRDGVNSFMYDATGGAVLMAPNVAELTLVLLEGDSSVGVTMNVSPGNGIVAGGCGRSVGRGERAFTSVPMNELSRSSSSQPAPVAPRVLDRDAGGDEADLPFLDGLQKQHSKALGFFPRAQMEGYSRISGC
jgi:hypothetical protein